MTEPRANRILRRVVLTLIVIAIAIKTLVFLKVRL